MLPESVHIRKQLSQNRTHRKVPCRGLIRGVTPSLSFIPPWNPGRVHIASTAHNDYRTYYNVVLLISLIRGSYPYQTSTPYL